MLGNIIEKKPQGPIKLVCKQPTMGLLQPVPKLIHKNTVKSKLAEEKLVVNHDQPTNSLSENDLVVQNMSQEEIKLALDEISSLISPRNLEFLKNRKVEVEISESQSKIVDSTNKTDLSLKNDSSVSKFGHVSNDLGDVFDLDGKRQLRKDSIQIMSQELQLSDPRFVESLRNFTKMLHGFKILCNFDSDDSTYSLNEIGELLRSEYTNHKTIALTILTGILKRRQIMLSVDTCDVEEYCSSCYDLNNNNNNNNNKNSPFSQQFKESLNDVIVASAATDVARFRKLLIQTVLKHCFSSSLPNELPSWLLYSMKHSSTNTNASLKLIVLQCLDTLLFNSAENIVAMKLWCGLWSSYGVPSLVNAQAKRPDHGNSNSNSNNNSNNNKSVSYHRHYFHCMENLTQIKNDFFKKNKGNRDDENDSDVDDDEDNEEEKEEELKLDPMEEFALKYRWNSVDTFALEDGVVDILVMSVKDAALLFATTGSSSNNDNNSSFIASITNKKANVGTQRMDNVKELLLSIGSTSMKLLTKMIRFTHNHTTIQLLYDKAMVTLWPVLLNKHQLLYHESSQHYYHPFHHSLMNYWWQFVAEMARKSIESVKFIFETHHEKIISIILQHSDHATKAADESKEKKTEEQAGNLSLVWILRVWRVGTSYGYCLHTISDFILLLSQRSRSFAHYSVEIQAELYWILEQISVTCNDNVAQLLLLSSLQHTANQVDGGNSAKDNSANNSYLSTLTEYVEIWSSLITCGLQCIEHVKAVPSIVVTNALTSIAAANCFEIMKTAAMLHFILSLVPATSDSTTSANIISLFVRGYNECYCLKMLQYLSDKQNQKHLNTRVKSEITKLLSKYNEFVNNIASINNSPNLNHHFLNVNNLNQEIAQCDQLLLASNNDTLKQAKWQLWEYKIALLRTHYRFIDYLSNSQQQLHHDRRTFLQQQIEFARTIRSKQLQHHMATSTVLNGLYQWQSQRLYEANIMLCINEAAYINHHCSNDNNSSNRHSDYDNFMQLMSFAITSFEDAGYAPLLQILCSFIQSLMHNNKNNSVSLGNTTTTTTSNVDTMMKAILSQIIDVKHKNKTNTTKSYYRDSKLALPVSYLRLQGRMLLFHSVNNNEDIVNKTANATKDVFIESNCDWMVNKSIFSKMTSLPLEKVWCYKLLLQFSGTMLSDWLQIVYHSIAYIEEEEKGIITNISEDMVYLFYVLLSLTTEEHAHRWLLHQPQQSNNNNNNNTVFDDSIVDTKAYILLIMKLTELASRNIIHFRSMFLSCCQNQIFSTRRIMKSETTGKASRSNDALFEFCDKLITSATNQLITSSEIHSVVLNVLLSPLMSWHVRYRVWDALSNLHLLHLVQVPQNDDGDMTVTSTRSQLLSLHSIKSNDINCNNNSALIIMNKSLLLVMLKCLTALRSIDDLTTLDIVQVTLQQISDYLFHPSASNGSSSNRSNVTLLADIVRNTVANDSSNDILDIPDMLLYKLIATRYNYLNAANSSSSSSSSGSSCNDNHENNTLMTYENAMMIVEEALKSLETSEWKILLSERRPNFHELFVK